MLSLILTIAAAPELREDFAANVLGGEHPRDRRSTPFDKPAEELVDAATERFLASSKSRDAVFLELEKRNARMARHVEDQVRKDVRKTLRRSLYPVTPLMHSKHYTYAEKERLLAEMEAQLDMERFCGFVCDWIEDKVQDQCKNGAQWIQDGCETIKSLVEDLFEIGKEYWKEVKEVSKQAVNGAKAGIRHLKQYVKNKAKQVGQWLQSELLSIGGCSISPTDIIDLFGGQQITDMIDLFNNIGDDFVDLRGATTALERADAAEAAAVAVVAGSACSVVWGVLGTPLAFLINLLTLVGDKCKAFGDANPAVTLGVVGGLSVDIAGGVAVEGGAGLEVGVGVSLQGERMCYIGGCAGVTLGAGPKVGVSASAEAGIAVSFFKDATNIPGKASTYGFGLDLEAAMGAQAGAGLGIDFFTGCSDDGWCYANGEMADSGFLQMLKNTFGGGITLTVSAGVGAGGGVKAGYSTALCYTPLCVNTVGEACGGGEAGFASLEKEDVSTRSRTSATAHCPPPIPCPPSTASHTQRCTHSLHPRLRLLRVQCL